jgi:hypothetical protein
MVEQLRVAGIEVDVDPTAYSMGRFASLKDPEGDPIQLWQTADDQGGETRQCQQDNWATGPSANWSLESRDFHRSCSCTGLCGDASSVAPLAELLSDHAG